MPQGFQAWNSSGILQVDTDTFNMGLVVKGTGTWANQSWGSTTVQSYSFTQTGLRNPVLAVAAASGVDFWSAAKNNGSGSFTFYTYSAGATNGTTFTYYLFDSMDIANPTDHFGLQVFNSSGAQVYHSSAKILRVAGGIGSYTTTTLASGPTYAVCTCSMERAFTSTYIGPSNYSNLSTYSSAQISGNVITTLQQIYESYITATAQTNTDNGSPYFLAIDVSNY